MSKRETSYFILVSLIANLAAVVWVISGVPGSTADSSAVSLSQILQNLPKLIVMFFVVLGPWLLAFSNSRTPSERPVAGAFAALSLFTCVGFLVLKSSAPTEAISYHVALYLPVLWGSYFLCWLTCRSKDSDGGRD